MKLPVSMYGSFDNRVIDADNYLVCTASGLVERDRIIASLNACAAIPSQDLEHFATWRHMVTKNARPGDVANLILERDALRAKLDQILDKNTDHSCQG